SGMRKSRSWTSLKTLSSTKAASSDLQNRAMEMSCTEVEYLENLATSFVNLGRPPTTGITKLGRSNFQKNLASCRESVGTFSLGSGMRKSRSWTSLKTLSSTKAASA
ncbi:Unknown protein, partial [Striga hermonthica]